MKLIAIIFLFFSVVSAIPFGKRSLVLPVNDTFYQEPANLASYAVGEIIQKRQISNPFYILIVPQLVKSVYQFQVRSEDSHGNPMAIVTTLFVPTFGNRDTLLSYHIAEDAANIDCAPSFTMQAGSNSSASLQAEETFIQAAINQGWYVVYVLI